MALSKSVQAPTGVAATYWIPGQVHSDKVAGTVGIVLHGFISEAARRGGCRPALGMPELIFTATDFPNESDIRCIPSRTFYAAIRARISAAVAAEVQGALVDPMDPAGLLVLLDGAADC
jgi:hypothetical protein